MLSAFYHISLIHLLLHFFLPVSHLCFNFTIVPFIILVLLFYFFLFSQVLPPHPFFYFLSLSACAFSLPIILLSGFFGLASSIRRRIRLSQVRYTAPLKGEKRPLIVIPLCACWNLTEDFILTCRNLESNALSSLHALIVTELASACVCVWRGWRGGGYNLFKDDIALFSMFLHAFRSTGLNGFTTTMHPNHFPSH